MRENVDAILAQSKVELNYEPEEDMEELILKYNHKYKNLFIPNSTQLLETIDKTSNSLLNFTEENLQLEEEIAQIQLQIELFKANTYQKSYSKDLRKKFNDGRLKMT